MTELVLPNINFCPRPTRLKQAKLDRPVNGASRDAAPQPEVEPIGQPRPLTRKSTPSDYPIDALGDVLAPAARAISARVQCAPAMAGQSVLAVASLAAQAVADVELPMGQTRPLSLFMLTVAASGDRKSSTDNEANVPVRMREKQLRDVYEPLAKAYAIALAAWRAQKNQIERAGKMTIGARSVEIEALGPEPEPPLRPVLTIGETTAEGLAKHMPQLHGALGVFSAEGGQFLSGHGFTPEAKLRTVASFASLWDGAGLRRLRAGDGLIDLHGRRLAAHLLLQPEAAAGVLSDPVLRDQGFLSRFLVVAPDSLAGSRLWKEPADTIEPALRKYAARVLSVFESPISVANAIGNELSPRPLRLSNQARRAWINFHDETERDMRSDGRFMNFRDVAGKAAEQAARIAGVLAIIDDRHTQEIGADAMTRGCRLLNFYLGEAVRLASEMRVPEEVKNAQILLDWLHDQKMKSVSSIYPE